MYFKELNDLLDFNATNYPGKSAFIDENYQISWKNLKSVLAALEKKLKEDYELSDLETTIILDGEYCITHVLIIILGILKGWVIVPKNRTLIRSNKILVDAIEIRVNEIPLYEIINSSDKSHEKVKTFSFEKTASNPL